MNIYGSKHYKLLLLIPITIVILALFFTTKVEYGIDLKGGTLINVPIISDFDAKALESLLMNSFDLKELEVREISGATKGAYIEFLGENSLIEAGKLIEAGDYQGTIDIMKEWTGELPDVENMPIKDKADVYFAKAREIFKNDLITLISTQLSVSPDSISAQEVGPSLGNFFLSQAKLAIILAFAFIVILVLYYFRNIFVAFTTLEAAFFDVLVGYAALGLFNIPLSLATIAPLLMLIGYSIDSEIMMNERMLKRKGSTNLEKLNGALKTGITMSGTALASMFALLAVSYYANITVLFNISLVLIMGLSADMIASWCTNAVLILWYLESKKKTENAQ